MKRPLHYASLLTGTLLALAVSSFASESELAEKLKKSIPADDVVFFYEFNGDNGLIDSVSGGQALTLREPAVVDPTGGREGGGLVIQAPFSIEDNGNCAETRNAVKSFPAENVSFDFFFKPDDAALGDLNNRSIYLFDQMYAEKTGFQGTYNPKNKKLTVRIGSGDNILSATSNGLTLHAGNWTHLAFTYDSKEGKLTLFENGEEVGSTTQADFGPINYGAKPFRIGNRIGSNYGNACGVFDDVRMTRRAKLF